MSRWSSVSAWFPPKMSASSPWGEGFFRTLAHEALIDEPLQWWLNFSYSSIRVSTGSLLCLKPRTLLQITQIGQSTLRRVLKPALRNLRCIRNVFVASRSVLWPLSLDISAGRPSMDKLVSPLCGLQSSCGNITKIIQQWWRSKELKFNRKFLSPNVNEHFENKSAFVFLEYWYITYSK